MKRLSKKQREAQSNDFSVEELSGGVDFVPNEDDLALDLVIEMDFETCCPMCAHYQGGSTCQAFPQGIPDEILRGNIPHNKPYQGDNGVLFQAKN